MHKLCVNFDGCLKKGCNTMMDLNSFVNFESK